MSIVNYLKYKINYFNRFKNPYYIWWQFHKWVKKPDIKMSFTRHPSINKPHMLLQGLGYTFNNRGDLKYARSPYLSINVPCVGLLTVSWGFYPKGKVSLLNDLYWSILLELWAENKVTKTYVSNAFNQGWHVCIDGDIYAIKNKLK